MARNEFAGLGRDGGGAVGSSKKSDGFIDRTKVRILLCDNDPKSSREVVALLCKCSYQVTSVKSARQVIDALNAEGPDIDIILTEVDLPMTKGMKLLKYITRDSNLRRIPVIMMSAQDEVSVVVKCLRFGAADYLVKPLRSNELLNLWTHMWRRRRMLGLTEKNILSFDVDVVASDPSDPNTNSTTLFSDDTDDRSRKSANPDVCMPALKEADLIASSSLTATPAISHGASHLELQQTMDYWPKDPVMSDRKSGPCSFGPKKCQLKLGESSAFLTYVKSSMNRSVPRGVTTLDVNIAHSSKAVDEAAMRSEPLTDVQTNESGGKLVDDNSNGNGMLETFSIERSCTLPVMKDYEQPRTFKESAHLQVPSQSRNEQHHDIAGIQTHSSYSYYMAGMMNQVMMPPAASQHYQKNMHDLQNHATHMPSQFPHHLPQCPPHVPPFPFYPYNLSFQPGQIPTTHQWTTPHGGSAPTEVKLAKVDRREAALMKFRQKRKERCFDKKIRYVNRKKLAERRPRVRGQFVRKMNGVNVDLNGLPSTEFDAEGEEEYDDEQASRDSSNDNDA
uniref:Two-component response regulator-like APRR1 n=1 Tax=Kalanchoe fedtschenkoi TaxID=63787 RepID=A0A7N0TN36_KALFE